MIVLDQLTASVGSFFKRRRILSSVSIQIPTDRRIALVSQPDEDKKRFIALLAGLAKPSSGTITRFAEVSFPVGQLPGFAREHTVRLNVAHAARLYGADVAATVDVVEQVLDIGRAFDKPYGNMPRRMRNPLAQAVALALPFDLYLLTDDRLGPPDVSHKRRRGSAGFAELLFEARAKTSGMIIPTQNVEYARKVCDTALVLQNGSIGLFEDIDEAFQGVQQTRTRRVRRRNKGDD